MKTKTEDKHQPDEAIRAVISTSLNQPSLARGGTQGRADSRSRRQILVFQGEVAAPI
jgi:hypothetical protein